MNFILKNNQMTKFFSLTLIIVLGLITIQSCKKDDTAEKQAAIDDQIILDYLAANNIQAEKHESGLYYVITVEGNGDQPNNYSTVEVFYKGYLTNGDVFDQTTNAPYTSFLQNLITGWQIGIPLLKEGGSGTFFIPSALGYGDQATSDIPANSVLIFEIDLVSIL